MLDACCHDSGSFAAIGATEVFDTRDHRSFRRGGRGDGRPGRVRSQLERTEEDRVPAKDASGRELSDVALRVLQAVSNNDGEATAADIVRQSGDDPAAVKQELASLVRTGHLAGPPRGKGEVSYGLLPAGRVALRLS
jgi:hypothetical protein